MNKFITLLILPLLLFLSACTTVLIGGAGAGGYAVGTDERPVGVISEDISITTRVKTTLIKDKQIDAFDINVDTYRSVVTLYGHVKSSAQLNRAISLTSSLKGVSKVISKLTVIQ